MENGGDCFQLCCCSTRLSWFTLRAPGLLTVRSLIPSWGQRFRLTFLIDEWPAGGMVRPGWLFISLIYSIFLFLIRSDHRLRRVYRLGRGRYVAGRHQDLRLHH